MERSNEFTSKFNEENLENNINELNQEINYKFLLIEIMKYIKNVNVHLTKEVKNINRLIDKKNFELAYKLTKELKDKFGKYNTDEINYLDNWLKENELPDNNAPKPIVFTQEEINNINKFLN